MIYKISVLPEAEKVLKKWKKSNPQLYKKYNKIYHELTDHPRTGIGHPEPLVGG
jgi:toxin YoeB